MGKYIKFTLVISALLIAGPWLTSFAYGDVNNENEPVGVSVEAAVAPALPAMTVFGQSIGGVTPGDLFYIDARDSSGDILASLYITNAPELTPYLRYLTLNVSVYYESEDGVWTELIPAEGKPVTDTCITLRNSPVYFNLPGLARYKIAIDSGSYYCIKAAENSADVSPQFFMTLEQA